MTKLIEHVPGVLIEIIAEYVYDIMIDDVFYIQNASELKKIFMDI